MCEKIDRFKYLPLVCNGITIAVIDGNNVKHLRYKPNGKIKKGSAALLYEYELVGSD